MNAPQYLAVCCGVYLVISVITNRGFIIAPRYRAMLAEAEECRARATLLASRMSDGDVQRGRNILAAITDQLDKVAPTSTSSPKAPSLLSQIFLSPLTKLAALQITLDAINRRMVYLVSDSDLADYGATSLSNGALDDSEVETAKKLATIPSGDGRRFAISEAQRARDTVAEQTLMAQFDRERVAMWLAIVGLFVAFAVGFFRQHEITLLIGAVGGFLAPVVSTLVRAREDSFWGVMVLSPVGGALTAVGGLLLVQLLVAAGVLGQTIFANAWDQPTSTVALALALLFGFSGRLFSQLAISATSQLSATSNTSITT